MRTHRAPVIAALAAVAALAAGCSTSGNLEEPAMSTVAAPTQEETAEEVVTEVVTKEAPAEESKAEKPKKDAPKKKEKCASLPKDPRKQYPGGSAPGRMPNAKGHDTQYWIEDIENYYDPCAPVSWIIFHGGRGGMEGPAHTGASVSSGIAFYINGEPDGEMRTFRGISDVSLNGDTINFEWGERQQDLSGSVKLQNHVTLSYSNGRIEAVGGDVDAFNQYWDREDQYMLGHYD